MAPSITLEEERDAVHQIRTRKIIVPCSSKHVIMIILPLKISYRIEIEICLSPYHLLQQDNICSISKAYHLLVSIATGALL